MYFKILREDLTHNGYTYHKGLNVDPNLFDPTPDCRGGLFFSDTKHILKFCDYGTKIAEVVVPEGELIVQVNDGYKAHQIILKEIKDLWTVETFEWLIECGVDIHADNDGALYWAACYNHLDVVKYLVEQGADIHSEDEEALCCAAGKGHLEIVKYLVEKGADIHVEDDCAFGWAAEGGHLEVVKYLVEHGADINAFYNYAFRKATENGYLEVVKYLVEHGADEHAAYL